MHSVNYIINQTESYTNKHDGQKSLNYHVMDFLRQSARYLNLTEKNLQQVINPVLNRHDTIRSSC